MRERDSDGSNSTEKKDLNENAKEENLKRKNQINPIHTEKKDLKNTGIQNGNHTNQGDAKKQYEHKEFVDSKGVHHGPIVEVHGYKGETHGGALSSREAIEYTDNDGRVHRGFFTPEKRETSFETDWEIVAKKAYVGHPEFVSIIQRITEDHEEIEYLRNAGKLDYKNGNYDGTEEWFQHHYTLLGRNKEFVRIIHQLAAEAWRLKNLHGMNRQYGIEVGDIIAKRASAMTDVALELGYPELLANSYRLILSRDGRYTKGVFIEAAELDGVDRSNLPGDNPIFDAAPEEFDNPQMLKSLANLQILDYLCGNVDRHSGNFFVRQDRSDPKHPHLIGVQGIDNDLSFCVTDGGEQELAKEEDLLVISSEMANAILQLQNEKLEEIMRKNGITNQKQINSARSRLEKLQVRINARHKIIEDRRKQFKENNGVRPDQTENNNKADRIDPPDKADEAKKTDQTEEDFLYEPRLKTNQLTLKGEPIQNLQGEYVQSVVKEVRLDEDPKSILIIEDDKYWEKLNLATLVPSQYALDEKLQLWEKEKEPRQNIFGKAQRVRDKIRLARKLAQEEKERERENPDKQKSKGIRYTKHTMIPELDQIRNMIIKEYRHYCDIREKFRNADGENPERSDHFKRMKEAYENIIKKYEEVIPDLKEIGATPGYVIGRLNKFYEELGKASKTAEHYTTRYLEYGEGKYFKKAPFRTRIGIAGELKTAMTDTASRELFENQLKFQQKKQDELAKKPETEISDYMKEQMFGLMSGTLYQNYMAIPADDPMSQKALEALRAQKRLWEYSRTQWKTQNNPAQEAQDKQENKAPQVQDKQENKAQQVQDKQANKAQQAQQAFKDVNIILEYAPDLKGVMAEQIAGGKDQKAEGLTPVQALKALHVLYQREYDNAKKRSQKEFENATEGIPKVEKKEKVKADRGHDNASEKKQHQSGMIH